MKEPAVCTGHHKRELLLANWSICAAAPSGEATSPPKNKPGGRFPR